jgi:hypothetical protein
MLEVEVLAQALWMQSSRDSFRTSGAFVCASAATLVPTKTKKIPNQFIVPEDCGILSPASNKRR